MTIYRWHKPFIISLTLLLPGISAAQGNTMQGMDMSASLGRVHFDNSCSPEVRADIDQGVAYLYSFWFPESRRQFETAAQRDPACSVAYWGEAMADYEQIIGGGLPQGAQLKAGLEAITKAKSASEKTAREQAYIDAIAIIYAAASIPDHDARVRRYSAAMGAIHTAYPTDNQAAIIYAMSVLKDGMPDDPNLVLARKALAILKHLAPRGRDRPAVGLAAGGHGILSTPAPECRAAIAEVPAKLGESARISCFYRGVGGSALIAAGQHEPGRIRPAAAS